MQHICLMETLDHEKHGILFYLGKKQTRAQDCIIYGWII